MISSDDIKHLAKLARIDITPAEGEGLRTDLDRILAYVSELSAVPTDGVEPRASGSVNSASSRSSRDDRSRETALPGTNARSAFPASRDGYCEVPEVFAE